MKDAEGRTVDQQGTMTDASGKVEGDEGFDFETATLQGGYDESTGKMDTSDSYEGYKQEHKGLGAEAKTITDQLGKDATNLAGYQGKFDTMAGEAKTRGDAGEAFQQGQGTKFQGAAETGASELQALGQGVMKDASGKKEGEEGYDSTTASKQGGYAQITGDQQAAAAARGETAAGTGVAAANEAATGIKSAAQQGQASAQTGVAASGQGAAGFQQGAQDVAGVQGRFGEEGFEKDVSGYESQIQKMGEKAMSGDVGQSQAAMLKGQMEEGRMASQKGSEEKLRREMAQSGASPAEIASKVAQFQKSSAGQQAQAGRSEALSSQLQGQQMGQSQLGQAAGLMGQGAGMAGQRAGMAGQQASLGAQQAALRGQAAGMQMQGAQMGMSGAQMGMQGAQQAGQMGMAGANMGMQGAQMGMQGAAAQQNARLASLQGQGAMSQAASGMNMQGIQGNAAMNAQGNQIGSAGANQQANMMGQGMGAVQAAGAARGQQLGGLAQQGGAIDSQGNYTQAQLNDTMAQQTQQYSADQTEATRAANASANSGGGGSGGGGIIKKFTSALGISDIRLKDNIKLLEEGKDGDPNIYSFKYKWDSDTTWSGVMAQELLNTKHADAVETHPNGYYMVDYGKLGIPMTQLSAKEQHGV